MVNIFRPVFITALTLSITVKVDSKNSFFSSLWIWTWQDYFTVKPIGNILAGQLHGFVIRVQNNDGKICAFFDGAELKYFANEFFHLHPITRFFPNPKIIDAKFITCTIFENWKQRFAQIIEKFGAAGKVAINRMFGVNACTKAEFCSQKCRRKLTQKWNEQFGSISNCCPAWMPIHQVEFKFWDTDIWNIEA